MPKMLRLLPLVAPLLLSLSSLAQTGDGWPTYGGDAGGQRYSTANQITRANVAGMHPVWTYHTHALESTNSSVPRSAFEATPILFHNTLYLSTPFDRVIALDPATGAERWTYDPHIPDNILAGNYTSRGVAAWSGTKLGTAGPGVCATRIYIATLDARLIAMDAATGALCRNFGTAGQIDLKQGVAARPGSNFEFYGNTSPATVVGDVIIVGSAVGDNQAVDIQSGVIRGFDARTGAQLWSWEPIPWAARQSPRTGAANSWSIIAADPGHHLAFIPTGAPSPDFYGGLRPGDNKDANSLVALDTLTGKKVWAFQLVHHDVWDYDVAAEPLLFTYKGTIPAVAVAAKTGLLFIFNRLTGEPLSPITERRVPKSEVPGEQLSPTQPFSALPALTSLTLDRDALTGHSDAGLAGCKEKLSRLRYDGIYTPPGLHRSTLQFPGSLGGVNWGSMSLDPDTATLYANTNGSAYEIRLVPQPGLLEPTNPRDHIIISPWIWAPLALAALVLGSLLRNRKYPGTPAVIAAMLIVGAGLYFRPYEDFPIDFQQNMINSPDAMGEVSPNEGAPYRIFRRVLQDDDHRPCTPQPWGSSNAINLNTGTVTWRKPLGTMIPGEHTGTVNFGAPIVTAGGLLFTAATSEPLLRAIDKSTGEEVWAGQLPVPAQSTPMTYMFNGRQYVVVAAGGHGGLGTPLGDSVVAFALP